VLTGKLNRTELPDVPTYLSGLQGLIDAIASTPSVAELSTAWNDLALSLAGMPSGKVTTPPVQAYATQQGALPTLPTALLDGGLTLEALLASVPTLVDSSVRAVVDAYNDTKSRLDMIELAIFGRERDGYTGDLIALRPAVEASWSVYTYTFLVPVSFAFITICSCILRVGRPSLHAGQFLLSLLPIYMLLGASIELPAAIMLQDACNQVPFLVGRLLTHLAREDAQFESLKEPLTAWVTNCEEDDPIARFYLEMESVASEAQYNATHALAALQLRPTVQASVERLRQEVTIIAERNVLVGQTLECSTVYHLYLDAKTAVCCDVAYAFTAIWSMRLICILAMLSAIVSAIAGYKRFRRQRDLWGPYASIQALEVGSYL